MALRLDQAGIDAVAARDDVVKVSLDRAQAHHQRQHRGADPRLRHLEDANGLGKGVRVGIIDTGIDYTHRTSAAPGTAAAYDAAKAASTSPTWRDGLPAWQGQGRGGYDFVGDDYDATRPRRRQPNPTTTGPKPDTNPLDCNGHGTHVVRHGRRVRRERRRRHLHRRLRRR